MKAKAGPLPKICNECKEKREQEKKKSQDEIQTGTCDLCGRSYVKKSGHSKYCPDCRLEVNGKKREEVPKKPQQPKTPLWKVVAEAKAHGMSYGQYVALQTSRRKIRENYESEV